MTTQIDSQIDTQAMVFVIDDDASVRDGMLRLFRSVGLRAEAYGSSAEFRRSPPAEVPCCLVLDVRLPGASGLEFQNELIKADVRIPVIFISGHGDIPMTVKAMKAGAIEFLPKPFRDEDMLRAVQLGIERDRARRASDGPAAAICARFAVLNEREQDVMGLVTEGLMNKQIAGEMKLAEITIKLARASLMRKMGARSLPDLVRMADIIGVRRKS
jgi:FixJ family two-component response regulator